MWKGNWALCKPGDNIYPLYCWHNNTSLETTNAPHVAPCQTRHTAGLCCAAAVAVLDVIKEENLLQNAEQVGKYLIEELKKFDQVLEVRGRGLMIGIELPAELAQVKKDLLSINKIFTGEAKPNVIRILPALNITKEIADRFLTAFDERLKA